jgi:hypothetical protein
MTSTATPVSAAAKQQHHNNYDKDQFHRKSPLMAMTSNSELPAVNKVPPSGAVIEPASSLDSIQADQYCSLSNSLQPGQLGGSRSGWRKK